MLYWVNFLHIHQPPTQDSWVIKKVASESYALILDILDKYPDFKITMNISGSLLEELQDNNLNEIIDRLRKHVAGGQIELTGSAMYHPILPLIPKEEIRHQISLQEEKAKEVFGEHYKPRGFYLPEMAYSKKVAKIVHELGFKWIILDEIHSPKAVNSSIKYRIKGNLFLIGLSVLFRNRKFSKAFPPKLIYENLKDLDGKYLITAHDGEMYGHWHKDEEKTLEKILNNQEVKNITVSEYLTLLSQTETIKPRKGSWESTKEELRKRRPFVLWSSPGNKIQKRIWYLAKWVHKIISKYQNDPNYKWAKRHYDRGISSCFWWWASEKKVDVWSPISWNPTDVEKGADELLKAVRSLESLNPKTKTKAEKLFSQLSNQIWKRHWKKSSNQKKK